MANDLSLPMMPYQVAAAYEADVEFAHLTVKSSRAKTQQGKYYSDNSKYACSGVDLPNNIV